MTGMSASYVPTCNVLVLRNYSKELSLNLSQVLLLLSLVSVPHILCTLHLHLDPEDEFLFASDMQVFFPSLTHSYDNYSHHGLPIYRSCKIIVAMSIQIFVVSGNCLLIIFLVLDR